MEVLPRGGPHWKFGIEDSSRVGKFLGRSGFVKQLFVCLIIFFGLVTTVAGETQKSKSKNNSSTAAAQPPASTSPRSTEASEEFIIGPEDGLSINVWREPELSTSVTVRPDGKITLPLINEIQAGGLTTKQLQDRIAEKLKDFIASPVVTVSVRDIRSQSVIIMGEVVKPGTYPFGSPLTVLELISRAGGFREYAKSKKVRIIRTENGKQVQYPFNYKDFIGGKNPNQNITLKNGDLVIVP